MRLIDADMFEAYGTVIPEEYREQGKDAFIAGATEVLEQIDNAQTVDPESLPIVQQLRADMETLISERDTAILNMKTFSEDWYKGNGGFPCKYCKNQLPDGKCSWYMQHNESNVCAGRNFEWRGLVKESAIENNREGA